MAVLVLYGRSPEEAVSWPTLVTWLRDAAPSLRHCLIYDNSANAMADAALLPERTSLVWEPANRGTAGAYSAAAAMAACHGCDRLLLLDQDTCLPADYLHLAALAAKTAPEAVALLPRVYHGKALISPATVTSFGSIRPSADPTRAAGMATAISSGAIVRCDLIARIAFPTAIWLDYVDHWMFYEIASISSSIGLIDSDLSHDLSVRTPDTLSPMRLRSILAAEDAFHRVLGRTARAALPVRRLFRALRYATAGRFRLTGIALRAAVTATVLRP